MLKQGTVQALPTQATSASSNKTPPQILKSEAGEQEVPWKKVLVIQKESTKKIDGPRGQGPELSDW